MSPLALALLAAAPAQAQASPPPAQELADPLADPAAPAAGDVAKLPDAARALAMATPAALVRDHPRHARGDPLERLNRDFFALNEGLDRALFRPAAMGYRHVVPEPVRAGLRNFFANVFEPVVVVNFLLQLKPGKAAETLGRFALNSTVGLAGLIDVAKRPPFRLPHRDNGFGSTLGRYGVGPGPYLFLPFAGPTTLRDLIGGQGDRLVHPFLLPRRPFDQIEYQVPKAVITGLDARAEADDELKALYAGAVDPYATLRSVFLQNRAGEIAALRHPHAAAVATPATAATPELTDPLADPAAAPPVAPATPDAAGPAELTDPLTDPAAAPAADPAAPARR